MSRISQKRDVSPYLQQDLPHWAARGLSYLLIVLFSVSLLLSILIRIPQVVSTPFVLVPVQGTDPIRALYEGTIVKVNVTEGQFVSKGTQLYAIRSDDAVDRASEYKTVETNLKGALQSLQNSKKKFENQHLADIEQLEGLERRSRSLEATIELKKSQLALLQQKSDSYHKMLDNGIISQADYTNQQLETGKMAVELQELQTNLSDTTTQLRKLKYEMHLSEVEFDQDSQTLNETVEKSKDRMSMLQNSVAGSSGQNLELRASCSGTVLRMRVNSAGAVVQDGDVLCELACTGSSLQAELNVPQGGVGLIKPGQGVKLLYDSFPYQRYGVKYGTVRWVSPASVNVNSAGVFRVLVDVKENSVKVRGQMRPLMPGMEGRADILVEWHPLITYAFEPIRQLRENLRQAPPEKEESR